MKSLWSFISFFTDVVGDFDYQPTFLKVFIEGFFYYISLAIIEELYCRGLLLNIIERISIHHKNSKMIAIIVSSIIFGLGHIFCMLETVDTYTLITKEYGPQD